MSSFAKPCINPKTGKKQTAFFHDDHFGRHQYGIGFYKDGSNFSLSDLPIGSVLNRDLFDWYRLKDVPLA